MGAFLSKQLERRRSVAAEKRALLKLLESSGEQFPGNDYRPPDRKTWMSALDPARLRVSQIVWPGTHDSATNEIGIRFISRPLGQCQSSSVYRQLVAGARVLDVRVQKDRRVCHGIMVSYSVDVVLNDVKRFISETESEVVILEVRTEFGHDDPPGFDKYLVEQLGDLLIPQDDALFNKTVAELLPGRIICVWKPRKSPEPKPGDALWSGEYLKDNWINTDLPMTKFESNMKQLSVQQTAASRKYFYRVENTVTPQADNPMVFVRPVTERIRRHARLFVAQAFTRGFADRLQVLSTDFMDEDFVDACVGLTHARLEGNIYDRDLHNRSWTKNVNETPVPAIQYLPETKALIPVPTPMAIGVRPEYPTEPYQSASGIRLGYPACHPLLLTVILLWIIKKCQRSK